MHSSRMHTVRNSSRLLVPGPGGVPGPRGVSAHGGCLLLGGAWSQGGSARGVPGPRGCLLPGEGVSQHALRQTPPPPPVNRMTDRCKNITFATSLRTVMIGTGKCE